jgi:hypothetical protein
VVFIGGDREVVPVERRAWMGPLDAPVLVLEGLAADDRTPGVGQQVAATVRATDQAQAAGSRTFLL